ncbi:secondary thiamine-phosphate synthase enzyme YjbQ [bacterium]|nr:secondary thiamine-phosphate synthase enzyme YjbQ [bacterium]
MPVVPGTIAASTRGDGDTLNITVELAQLVTKSGLTDGIATLFIGGSTAGITTIEYESGVIEDVQEVLETLAPSSRDWRHHRRWGDHNGHSHIRSALVGPSLSVPFVNGSLTLGTWQQVVLMDFDECPRTREVVVQIIGE